MVPRLMPYTLSAYGLSDTGLVRKNNEDIWGSLPQHHLFVLADGMGGHQAGEVAAREATLFFLRQIQKNLDVEKVNDWTLPEIMEEIRYLLEQTNHFVFDLSKTHDLLRGMGTTMLCLHFHDDSVIYAHVGDSRIYRMRDGILKQLTSDHTLIRELENFGHVSDRIVDACGYKNIITRAIGTERFVEPTVESDRVQANDLYLLCSDGLTDMVSNDTIANVLSDSFTVEEKVRMLIATAKRSGGHDNITCICVEVNEVSDLSR